MPGYLGGGGSGGSGGEITFPKELIDPVTKLRVSNPETLIDTDFEYGLQPTKWETLELINNTPSFFSKSGDTTIDGISSITTNAGTREITVRTALDHGLAVGIPINVTGSKSITADGAYIINSIPDSKTFTYLCKDNQPDTLSIEDLYTSIITGEFFQGSQVRISDAAGMTTDGEAISTITVTTDSTHGFGVNTPFYFLNLNSTLSQQFDSTNTSSKSFDSSNSATAQTFDGSNTLSSSSIDWSNSATSAGVISSISTSSAEFDTITVSHTTENFVGRPVGTPLYYEVTAATGFFATNPRGVVFLKTVDNLGENSSTFQVSELPDGDAIDILSQLNGTFQLANQARTFAGNNINASTQQTVEIINDTAIEFDATNSTGTVATVTSYSGSLVSASSPDALGWYFGTMVLYNTTGTPATGLSNNTTYFVDQFFPGSPGNFFFTLRPTPNGAAITSISGGTGTQTFTQIFVSVDRDIFHIRDNGFTAGDMLRYDTTGTRFGTSVDQAKDFYFVNTKFDAHNFTVDHTLGELLPITQSIGPRDYGTAITPTTATTVGLTAPLTFAITSGTLPTGLTYNTSTGVISGTPTATYNGTIVSTVTDAAGTQAFQTISFVFTQPPRLYDFTTVTFTPGGQTGRFGPSITQIRSGAGNPTWANTYVTSPLQGYILWTAPELGNYRITVRGGHGGTDGDTGNQGGGGIQLAGTFSFAQGEQALMTVGQHGIDTFTGDQDGGGGGGTFVTRVVPTGGELVASTGIRVVPLIIAGGGGGDGADSLGQDAQPGEIPPQGGTAGQGAQFGNGNGGGGFRSAGQSSGGQGWLQGAVGGQSSRQGGFGGGAGGDDERGAGGGGWTGGPGYDGPGSNGGGSYNIGASPATPIIRATSRQVSGFIQITKL